jgi:hypothetical protein
MGRDEPRFVNRVKLGLFGAVCWFVATLSAGILGNRADESWFGKTIGPWLLPVSTVVVVAAGIGWLVLAVLQRSPLRPGEREERTPLPSTPPVWRRPTDLFCGRGDEAEKASDLVVRTGAVVLAGVRDIGTSAVAEQVTQGLIDRRGSAQDRTHRFDLRSRSTREPYDAAATAGRIVVAFGVDEPSDGTGEVLARAAAGLLAKLPEKGTTLFLDNVSTPEQVAWLLQEWPADGPHRLVVAGETAVGDADPDRTVHVHELATRHLREIWDTELAVPEPAARQRIRDLFHRLRGTVTDDPVNELLLACVGRPGAVKVLARQIRRLSGAETAEKLVEGVIEELRAGGRVTGPLEHVWTVTLANLQEGLTEEAAWLLHALAELPVTGLTRGAVAAILDAGTAKPVTGEVIAPLEELRLRKLVRDPGGRYRLPQEIRGPIVRTSSPERRRAVTVVAVPALVRYFAGFVVEWATRLEVDAEAARAWFRDSEPSLLPLFTEDHFHDHELLRRTFADLCAIADGLDVWYTREQQSRGLLEVNDGLHRLARRVERDDVAALAACRIAAAHRLAMRFGEAGPWLDIAASTAKTTEDRIRAELDARVQVERALLTTANKTVEPEAVAEATTELTKLRAAGAALPGHAARLVTLGGLVILDDHVDDALDCLREAEKVARDARDAGSEAHSVELQGIAHAKRGHLADAVRCWQRARTMFARVGEDIGESRCLQHLGSTAVEDARMAGLQRDGRPVALSSRDAAAVALHLLERAKELRTGQPDTTLVDHYLAKARRLLTD